MIDLLIRGGQLYDGTGAPPRRGDVGVRDGKVVAVGDLAGVAAGHSIDAEGRAVAPGFVDHHQHGDITPLVDARCVSALGQGVTSIVVGNCGHGVAPGADPRLRSAAIIGYRDAWGLELDWPSYDAYFSALDSVQPGVNIAAFVGHGAVRLAVMGMRPGRPTPAELRRMQSIVDAAMRAGAVGMSSGLEYPPGMYADEAELTALCRVVGRHGGAYASHIRDRGDAFADAVGEAVRTAESAGVRLILSHLAPRPYASAAAWSNVSSIIDEAIDRGVPITIDTFPDAWGPSPIASLIPAWISDGPRQIVVERLARQEVITAAREAIEGRTNHLLRSGDPAELRLTSSQAHPEMVGLTLGQIGADWQVDIGDVTCRLMRDEGTDFYSVLIEHRYARDDDLRSLYRYSRCAFESDGVVTAPDGPLGSLTMNRSSYGYTARVAGDLVRDQAVLTLEEAVRRMTSLPAAAIGLNGRGIIREDAAADLVVFDPATVRDLSTGAQPNVMPAGFIAVVVNGVVALERGQLTGERSGRFIVATASGRDGDDG